MKLRYRSIPYKYHPASKASGHPFLLVRETGATRNLCYRGVPYRVPHAQPTVVPVKPVVLIYRGVTYFKLISRGIIFLINRDV